MADKAETLVAGHKAAGKKNNSFFFVILKKRRKNSLFDMKSYYNIVLPYQLWNVFFPSIFIICEN